MSPPKAITEFQGEYRFLSNFWPATVTFDDVEFPTVEHAYQAAKTLNRLERAHVLMSATPGIAKNRGKAVTKRPDWDNVKLLVMQDLVWQKFHNHADLKAMLLATGEAQLIEGNQWNDTFWGVCRGKGLNHLGRIIMNVRQELRDE